MYGLCGEF